MNEITPSVKAIKHLIGKKGWIDIISSGSSMYPLIMQGDICRFIPLINLDSLQKGDIVLFLSSQGELIAHRYYQRNLYNGVYHYIFKGDTNRLPDLPVAECQLIGKLALIRKRNFNLKARNILIRLWKSMVLLLPTLPIYCKQYLTFQNVVERT